MKIYNRNWIIENSLNIIPQYEKGILTLRGLHYQLVALGMTNNELHYKKVISAMTKARWDSLVPFDTFSDHDRKMESKTEYVEIDLDEAVGDAKDAIRNWMRNFWRSHWENQPNYVEVLIEKKALQGVFKGPCDENRVGLGACKGYPSLTFLNNAFKRYKDAVWSGKYVVVLYFGDHDPSGDDIPRSMAENLKKLGMDPLTFEIRRIALNKDQAIEWELPPAPAKKTDSRTKKWTGIGQVELDAVKPDKLQELCKDAIAETFDRDIWIRLKTEEQEQKTEYRSRLKDFVDNIGDEFE